MTTARADAARSDAVRNNAEWCAAVCRTHGHGGTFDDRLWWTGHRSPPLYPDAVTLAPDVRSDEVLDAVDTGPGCSVKDSWARLDLTAAGFTPLFEAQWIRRGPDRGAPPSPQAFTHVRTAGGLAAWAGAAGLPEGLFLPRLLADPAVRVLARQRDGAVVAGAALNRSGAVVGVTNLFTLDGDLDGAWAGVLAAVPGLPLVGYGRGPALAAALRVGFTAVGPLRVWVRPGSG